MAIIAPLSIFSLLLFFFTLRSWAVEDTSTLYFSKSTLYTDYQNMLTNFKIFIYPHKTLTTTTPFSLFYSSLLKSQFITNNPNDAHQYFLPFPFYPQSTRSLARLIDYTRSTYPFWNRSLGADHFYLSSNGVGPSSTRNVVELRKNAVQITSFPSPVGNFIPHKDLTLPPPNTLTIPFPPPRALIDVVSTTRRLGYWRLNMAQSQTGLDVDLMGDLNEDASQFLIESEPPDESLYLERLKSSKFCLFVYDYEVVGLGEALAYGCVPVVITDRPIQDLPLMDVIKWSEIALFVGSRVGHEQLKRVLIRTWESDVYERMRSLGVVAAQHFIWNESPQLYDAFHMVMYQVWLRRHAIRYAPMVEVEEVAQA